MAHWTHRCGVLVDRHSVSLTVRSHSAGRSILYVLGHRSIFDHRMLTILAKNSRKSATGHGWCEPPGGDSDGLPDVRTISTASRLNSSHNFRLGRFPPNWTPSRAHAHCRTCNALTVEMSGHRRKLQAGTRLVARRLPEGLAGVALLYEMVACPAERHRSGLRTSMAVASGNLRSSVGSICWCTQPWFLPVRPTP